MSEQTEGRMRKAFNRYWRETYCWPEVEEIKGLEQSREFEVWQAAWEACKSEAVKVCQHFEREADRDYMDTLDRVYTGRAYCAADCAEAIRGL